MSYDPSCIEICPDGSVLAEGKFVGTIEFAGRDGILGRLYGVGVHTLNGDGLIVLDEDMDDAFDDLCKARIRAEKALKLLQMTEPDIAAAIKILRGIAQ